MIKPVLTYRHLTGDDRPATGKPAVARDSPGTDPVVVLCCGMDTIVAGDASGAKLPTLGSLLESAGDIVREYRHWHLVATSAGTPVYAVALGHDELDRLHSATTTGSSVLERAAWRDTLASLDDLNQALLGRGMQVARWFATSQFCSACGTPTEHADTEAVARCPSCDHVQYPRVAPAMIVAVVKDGKILLARSPRFRGAFHSVLAGFVEPGESVEACIHREVCEETGITVKNLSYFGSQSWPFPHSLMLAYTAEWAGGDITIDEEEIEHADWYGPNDLPPVPSEVSIAGRMIRWFRETYGIE